jgi:hypothetical protein
MIMLLLRAFLVAGLITALYFVIRWRIQPSGFERCGRCEGRGFWYATGEKKPVTGAKVPADYQRTCNKNAHQNNQVMRPNNVSGSGDI